MKYMTTGSIAVQYAALSCADAALAQHWSRKPQAATRFLAEHWAALAALLDDALKPGCSEQEAALLLPLVCWPVCARQGESGAALCRLPEARDAIQHSHVFAFVKHVCAGFVPATLKRALQSSIRILLHS